MKFNSKKASIIGFGKLILGFVFLANPNISMIDPLPDFIGYALICSAIFRVGDVFGSMADARGAMFKMFWISLSRLPASALLLAITYASANERVMTLTFVFCYAVAECLYGAIAFMRLADGFSYIGDRCPNGEFLYAEKTARVTESERHNEKELPARKPKNGIESFVFATVFFFAVKFLLNVLPDVTLLSSYDSLGYITSFGAAMARFRPLIIAISAIIVFVFGLIWLVKAVRYISLIKGNKAFWHSISEEYESSLKAKTGMFVLRDIKVFYVLAVIGAFFAIDTYFDQINYLPDFVSAVLFFAAAFAAKRLCENTKALKITSVIYFAAAVFRYVAMSVFERNYKYSAVLEIDRAGRLFAVYSAANLLTQIFFVATAFALINIILNIVKKHTIADSIAETSNKTVPLINVFSRKCTVSKVLAVLSAVTDTLYFWFIIDVESVGVRAEGATGNLHIWLPRFQMAGLLEVVIALIFAVYLMSLISELSSEVKYRYKYE